MDSTVLRDYLSKLEQIEPTEDRIEILELLLEVLETFDEDTSVSVYPGIRCSDSPRTRPLLKALIRSCCL